MFVPIQLDPQTYVHGDVELQRVDAIAEHGRAKSVMTRRTGSAMTLELAPASVTVVSLEP
jgi:hypothetical protein